MAASVTVPEMSPPSVRVKLMFGVVAPRVTATGVPDVTGHPAQFMLLYSSFMYADSLDVRTK